MSDKLMLPIGGPPTHPGKILLDLFLKPLGMTQTQLAEKLGVPIQRVNTLIAGKRGVTVDTAILLARAFGTGPRYWMNLQANHDLWHALHDRGELPRSA